jgi:NAD(P)-dependent dehydrogenase (short-subunit alcohol dehydrogenase family)
MLLENKDAVIYGAGGAIGGGVARAFAREGARLFLAGRTPAAVDTVAEAIAATGGVVATAQVDALDETAVEHHAEGLAQRAGGIDVSFNAIGIPQQGIQGIPLLELSVERGSGVILTLTATPARLAAPLVGGMGAAWAAVEALSRGLAAELGPRGIRVVCLRPDAIAETATIREVYGRPPR